MNPWGKISLSDYENHMSFFAVHHRVDEQSLIMAMNEIGYGLLKTATTPLPNGKKLVMLDFER